MGIGFSLSPWRLLEANVLVVSGYYNTQNGNLDEAIENDDAALSLKPDFDTAFAERAEANRLYQRYDQALIDIDKALAINPDNVAFWEMRSSVHGSLQDHRAAASDLDRALTLKPTMPRCFRNAPGQPSISTTTHVPRRNLQRHCRSIRRAPKFTTSMAPFFSRKPSSTRR